MSDFLNGVTKPSEIAPMRSTFIIGTCNARCIQCPMRYSGEIQQGAVGKGGERIKYAEYKNVLRALSYEESIINFLPLASEFLLYKHWRDLAMSLRSTGVKLRFSTNAMALTKDNAEFLISNKLLGATTFSIDASSKETHSKIRIGLDYDKVVSNIRYFAAFASQHNYVIQLGFSMVLMVLNYKDMPGFVDLARSVREAGNGRVPVSIGIHSLQCVGPEKYLEFVETAHHSFINPIELGVAFSELQKKAEEANIQVVVFNKFKIKDFNDKYLSTLMGGVNPFHMEMVPRQRTAAQ